MSELVCRERIAVTRITGISRNSAVFYWKSVNLIGSPIIFYSPIENDCIRVAFKWVVF